MHARKTLAYLTGTVLLLAVTLLPSVVDARSNGYAPGVDPRPSIAGLEPGRTVANIVDEDYYTLPSVLPDTLRVLAIRVHFQPDTLSTTFGDGDFMYDFPDTVNPEGWLLDPPPHDKQFFQDHLLAARNYFSKFSYGNLTLAGYDDEDVEGGDVYPRGAQDSYELDYPIWTINYGNDDHQRLNEQLVKLFADSWTVADQSGLADDLAADGRTIDDYDIFIIFHAGSGNEFDTGYDLTPFDIPSVFISENDLQEFGGLTGGVDFAGSKVPNGIILPETQRQLGTDVGMHGTVVAQLGFAIGLPHLYNTETGDAGIGMLGLMDRGFGAFYGTIPIPPSAWSRVFMRWDEPVTVSSYSSIDTVRMGALHLPDDVFSDNLDDPDNVARLLRIPINDTEYYLAEVRRRDPEEDSLSYGWDRDGRMITFYDDYSWEVEDGFRVAVTYSDYDFDLPSSGVLLWHIDDRLIRNRYAEDRIQNDFDQRGIRLQEADGTWDIGKDYPFLTIGDGTELGWADDAFYRDNDSWAEANRPLFNPEFSTNTNPSSTSNDGGQTHLTINRFSDIADTMTFRINNGWIAAGFPAELPDLDVQDVMLANVDPSNDNPEGLTTDEIVLFTSGGDVYVYDGFGEPLGPQPFYAHSDPAVEFTHIVAASPEDADRMDLYLAGPQSMVWLRWDPELEQVATTEFQFNFTQPVADLIAVTSETPDPLYRVFALYRGTVDEPVSRLVELELDFGYKNEVELEVEDPQMSGWLFYSEANGIMDSTPGELLVLYSDGSHVHPHQSPNVYNGLRLLSGETLLDVVLTTSGSDYNQSVLYAITDHSRLISVGESWHPIPGRVGGGYAAPAVIYGEHAAELDLMPESGLRLLDFDRDGRSEPAFLADGSIYAFEAGGALSEGMPIRLSGKAGEPGMTPGYLMDSDGDGVPEWVMLNENGTGQPTVAVYDVADGRVLNGFPLSLSNARDAELTMVVGSVNGDDDVDIVLLSSAPGQTLLTVYSIPGNGADDLSLLWGQPEGGPSRSRFYDPATSTSNPSASGSGGVDDAYIWPNPVVRGDVIHVRFKDRGAGRVMVDVYDVAGRKHLSADIGYTAQSDVDVEVDVSALPSGVYVARLEVGGEVKLIRFAVVN